MSWEEAGGVGNAKKAIADLGKFSIATGVPWSRHSFCPVSRQGFSMSPHGSQDVGNCLVTT